MSAEATAEDLSCDRELRIDPEFAALIPALSTGQRAQLEENLKADGCREPLVVWIETGILLDGHNRYGICMSNDIEFEIEEMSFPDRDAAKLWVIGNQLGRRNLTPESIAYLRGKLYREERKAVGAPRGNANAALRQEEKQSSQGERIVSADTAKRLAEQFSTSPASIHRDAKFSEQLDALWEESGEDIRLAVIGDEAKLTRSDVARLFELDEENRKGTLRQILDDDKKKAREVIAERKRAIVMASAPKTDPGGTVELRAIEDLDLEPESVDMVFTDPPYHDEYVDLFRHLARVSEKALKPGGMCLVYAGKMYLPDVLTALGEHLEYVWQFIVFHPFSQTRSNSRAVFENYRPILVFRKAGPQEHASKRPWVYCAGRATPGPTTTVWAYDEPEKRRKGRR